MNQLKRFIAGLGHADGKMAERSSVLTEIDVYGARTLETRIRSGKIVINDRPPREGVWAYEAEVTTVGGYVITGPNGDVREVTAVEAQRLLGANQAGGKLCQRST